MTGSRNDDAPSGGASLGARLFSGTLWMFAMRWTVRLLGIVNVVVLARLLDKDDFGLVAMAGAIIALPTVLLDVGVEQAVIREQSPSRGIYNTAWTIRAMQMALVAVAIHLFGPLAASFYGDARVAEMLSVLAVMVVLGGLENIWTVSFRKNLDFRRDFAFNTVCKLLSVIVTIALAFSLRSYWALVYGQVAGAALRLVVSFAMAPERPVPTLCEWRRIWSFSQWTLAGGFASYIDEHADRLILGRLSDAGNVGAYTVGREIAEMPLTEIQMPANRVLGPGLSSLQNEPERLASALTKALGAVAAVAFPISVGLAVTAGVAIHVMLGEGWQSAVPVLQIVALASMFAAMTRVISNTLAVIGHIRSWTAGIWIKAALLLALGIPATVSAGPVGMACAFFVTQAVAFAFNLFRLSRHVPQFSFGSFARALQRPAASVLVMFGVTSLVAASGVGSAILSLLGQVAAGVLSYFLATYLIWRAQGQPDGLERMVLQRVAGLSG
jgi:O-antigen/teichoic acid export membrane protein